MKNRSIQLSLLILLLYASAAIGQQSGEVLVLSRQAKDAARLFNAAEANYDGRVTLASELPDG